MISTRMVWVSAVWVALALSACSGSSGGAAETVAPTTIPSTTLAPTTTLPPPTTLPASAVFLRSDGIGNFTFGAPYEGFEEGIPLERDSNDGAKFPIDAGNGFFSTVDGQKFFRYPRAREVCWNDGLDAANGYLCAYFGGADADTLQFVGWTYSRGAEVGTLFASFGGTVNALASEVPAISIPQEGECVTSASIGGIVVDLVSESGASFGDFSAAGPFVKLIPADARVGQMTAGATYIGPDTVC